ncbi:hypothetical protein HanRHA438_Chr16g0785951 [Helianthus annuus]|uniref:Uncharacterized protein n=1 Tax=Helianthus annuus TaxID=4232 RepID=A0A251S3B3_HELAN|nr:hypothetical protein HanIR_Chr16g0841701 [Helianthus annuus]KAJ0838157.1 hypothetical protein HanRHA438_Chr16g0785951 [Helianthus annuus]
MKLTATNSLSLIQKLDTVRFSIGVKIGSNSNFRSRSLANSRRRLPVARSSGAGEEPRISAGIPEIRMLVGLPAGRVARACRSAAH